MALCSPRDAVRPAPPDASPDPVSDLTDQGPAESQLRPSEERFRGLMEGLPEAVTVVDRGRVLYANRHLAQLVGADAATELSGCDVAELVDAADAQRLVDLVARAADSGTSPREQFRLGRRSRARVVVEVACQRMTYESTSSVLLLWRDLTEQRALQDRLMRSDRLASIGTLAAGMAHEINNPLSYVLANIDAVLGNLGAARQTAAALSGQGPALAGELDEFDSLLTEARKGAIRIRDIVRQLRVFSRSEEDSRSQVDLHAVLDASIQLSWNEIRHRARLVREWNHPPPVFASEGRLGQVFLNLLINAAQAIGEGRAQANEIRVRTFRAADGRAGVTISDTGCGIPGDQLGRIFDAFYTTKPVGVGTGLGLSICNSIVDRYGGTIEVNSELGRGTSFTVLLPPVPVVPELGSRSASDTIPDPGPLALEPAAATGPAAAPLAPVAPEPVAATRIAAPRPSSTSLRAALDRTSHAARPLSEADATQEAGLGARVLVVDDDALVARAATRILSREHDVTAVTSGVEALERISSGERFDVILCDLMMPELTGMQLHAELSRLAPDQAERMILISGGAFTAAARAFVNRVEQPAHRQALRPGQAQARGARRRRPGSLAPRRRLTRLSGPGRGPRARRSCDRPRR